jgi:AraC-like DNA-binding protein
MHRRRRPIEVAINCERKEKPSVDRKGRAGAVASDYREFPAPRVLSEHFVCFWTQTVSPRIEFAQRVLPDCCIDVVLVNEVPMVAGPWTKPFVARLAPGTKIVGARLHPGLAPCVLGVPAAELRNQYVPLRAVWGCARTAPFERIADEGKLPARMIALEEILRGLVVNAGPVDKATSAAIQWIARRPHGRVEQLSRWLGLSSRQVRRRFADAVGYGPKLFQSVLRFQRLLDLADRAGARGNMAQFATEADYSDQAHMTREVERFSGNPPTTLLGSSRCTLRLSGLLAVGGDAEF